MHAASLLCPRTLGAAAAAAASNAAGIKPRAIGTRFDLCTTINPSCCSLQRQVKHKLSYKYIRLSIISDSYCKTLRAMLYIYRQVGQLLR